MGHWEQRYKHTENTSEGGRERKWVPDHPEDFEPTRWGDYQREQFQKQQLELERSVARNKASSAFSGCATIAFLGAGILYGLSECSTSNSKNGGTPNSGTSEKSNSPSTSLAKASLSGIKLEVKIPNSTQGNSHLINIAKAYANVMIRPWDFDPTRDMNINESNEIGNGYRHVSIADCKACFDLLYVLKLAEECNSTKTELLSQNTLTTIRSFNWVEFYDQAILMLERAEAEIGMDSPIAHMKLVKGISAELWNVKNKSLENTIYREPLFDLAESLKPIYSYRTSLMNMYDAVACDILHDQN